MKKLSTLIIIMGILIGLSPVAGNLYIKWRENRLLEEWYNSVDAGAAEVQESLSSDPEEAYGQLQDAFAVNANNSQNNTDTSPVDTQPDLNGEGTAGTGSGNISGTPQASSVSKAKPAAPQVVLGIIKIDKIKVKYPVVEGVAPSNLKSAIGHIPGTAGLGQPGNCALAGHRNYTFGRFFNRLDELKEGDIISVSTKKEEFKYKVYEKLVVKPDDVSVIKGSKEDTVLTLITCTPIYVATHRLIVHARLEEKVLLEP